MSPKRIKPLTWSGWYFTSWFKNGAASSGRWSSASNSAKLNKALRKSCLMWIALRKKCSASSVLRSSIASIPRLKYTRSFCSFVKTWKTFQLESSLIAFAFYQLPSFWSSFISRSFDILRSSGLLSSCSRIAEFNSACSCSGSYSSALSK